MNGDEEKTYQDKEFDMFFSDTHSGSSDIELESDVDECFYNSGDLNPYFDEDCV